MTNEETLWNAVEDAQEGALNALATAREKYEKLGWKPPHYLSHAFQAIAEWEEAWDRWVLERARQRDREAS